MTACEPAVPYMTELSSHGILVKIMSWSPRVLDHDLMHFYRVLLSTWVQIMDQVMVISLKGQSQGPDLVLVNLVYGGSS